MAYSRDAFDRDQQETRLGAIADGLIYTNKIARESQRESQRELERAREREREFEIAGERQSEDMKLFRIQLLMQLKTDINFISVGQ